MFKKWENHRSIRYAYLQAHRKRFFGHTVSCADILTLLVEKILLYNIDQRAAAVAYHFTLAVFPTILFLFTLIPYIPIHDLEFMIMNFMNDLLPKGLYDFAAATIYDIVSRRQGGILSFGVLFALFTATNGMSALMTAFNMAVRTEENRGYLRAKWVSLQLTLLLSFVLVLAVLVIFLGGFVVDFLNENIFKNDFLTIFLLNVLRYGAVFGFFLLAISLIYRYAPKLKHGWRLFNVGSVVAALFIIVATYGFSYYLSQFASYNKLYGSIGTIIAMMYWFYLIALLLIFGFELNISIWNVKYRSKSNG
jgi:membrane protein